MSDARDQKALELAAEVYKDMGRPNGMIRVVSTIQNAILAGMDWVKPKDGTDALAAKVAELEAENGKLRTYAQEATAAITGLTAGGSEYFGRKIGGIYTADLPFCVERIRRAKDGLQSTLKDAIRERNELRARLAAQPDTLAGSVGDGALRERIADALSDPRLANLTAAVRQGDRDPPRCEEPTIFDINAANEWVGFVRKAVTILAERHPRPHATGATSDNGGAE